MSLAFEISREDVHAVLRRMGRQVDLDGPEVEAAFELVSEEDDRITDAALWGNDLYEQTVYAHDEIEAILKENQP